MLGFSSALRANLAQFPSPRSEKNRDFLSTVSGNFQTPNTESMRNRGFEFEAVWRYAKTIIGHLHTNQIGYRFDHSRSQYLKLRKFLRRSRR